MNQDGGRTSEYLKLLTAPFVVMHAHDFLKVDICDIIQIYLKIDPKRMAALKNVITIYIFVPSINQNN